MKKRLGGLEQQLFAYIQLRKLRTLRKGDLTGPLQISIKQERELLSRLSRADMIAQVRRGLYLVPVRLPLGGRWSPDEGLALNTILLKNPHFLFLIDAKNAFDSNTKVARDKFSSTLILTRENKLLLALKRG